MNFLSQSTSTMSLLMNKCSSVFSASSILSSAFSGDTIITRLLSALLQMIYFACKWVMYMVDVIYFYILQLAGVSADTSIFDSPNSDMTFNLLINNKETVVAIVKNLIAIAIVLILVTAVMAIIKQQSQAFKDKKAKKSPTGDVMRSVLKSFLLIILTPLIAILGIVASSVLLQSLFNATNLSETKSLSARVFNASASAANKYRIYAENGVRIPIKYKFSGDNKSDALNYTVQMIGNDKFPSFTYFDKTIENKKISDPVLENTVIESSGNNSAINVWQTDTYYTYYDTSNEYSPTATDGSQYKLYTTHVNEYYAMSDVIMYALDTMEKYYFVTIQELLESVTQDTLDNLKAESGGLFADWIEAYSIKFYFDGNEIGESDSSGYEEALKAFKNGTYDYIKYTSKYKGVDYDYYHVKGATDEMEGAKFTIAYKVEDGNEYQQSLNGKYYKDDEGNYHEADKYYYKTGSSTKKVDLYYFYDADKEKYQKIASFDGLPEGTKIYYKIGEDYFEIKEEMKDCFYYKNENNEYVSLTYGIPVLYSKILKYHYAPLVNGISFNNNEEFHSTYLTGGLITARGFFDSASYPTAIKRLVNGDIEFYRDDLQMISEGNVADVGTLDQVEVEEDEDEDDDKNVFQKIGSAVSSAWNSAKKFVSGIFNPLKLVPDLKLDASKVSTTYEGKYTTVYQLKDGELHLSYFFADSMTSSLSEKMYGVNLNNLFDPMQINYVILVIGSVMFLKICITAVFGLINRALNLLVMIMIYPVACATIPYDEATGTAKNGPYKKWSQKYTELLFSTFGLLLSLNFVFIIIPVIDKLEFFTPENFQNNKALGRIGNALYNPWMILSFDKVFEPNYILIATYVNKILRIIFQLSAFAVIAPVGKKGGGETFYSAIQAIVGTGPGALENSPLDAVKKTLKTMTSTFNKIFFPTLYLKNIKEKAMETMKGAVGFLPGSAIAMEASAKLKQMTDDRNKEKTKDELMAALKSKAPKEEVEQKLADYKSAYGIK